MIRIATGLVVWEGDNVKWFFEALNSLLAQEVPVDELFITLNGNNVFSLQSEIERSISSSNFKGPFYFLKNDKNRGLAYALNQQLSHTKCEFYMRMDSDDISLPKRISEFKKFLETQEEIVVCGSFTEEFGSDKIIRVREYPISEMKIRSSITVANPISHPTAFLHVDTILGLGGYNVAWQRCQDLELWTRVLKKKFRVKNIPVVLLRYRLSETQKKRKETRDWEFQAYMNAIRELGFSKFRIVFPILRLLARRVDLLSRLSYKIFRRKSKRYRK